MGFMRMHAEPAWNAQVDQEGSDGAVVGAGGVDGISHASDAVMALRPALRSGPLAMARGWC